MPGTKIFSLICLLAAVGVVLSRHQKIQKGISPVFSKSEYMTTIPSTTAVGTSVLQVNATDDGPVFYSLTGETGKDVFTIDLENGNIKLSRALYDVTESVTRLNATATDTDGNTSTASVVITILFENSNSSTETTYILT